VALDSLIADFKAHGPKYVRLKPIYLGDDLSSRQATCEAVREIGGHFLFTAKPSSHKTLYSWLEGAEVPTFEQKIKQGARDAPISLA
jgi:hypothetical protein